MGKLALVSLLVTAMIALGPAEGHAGVAARGSSGRAITLLFGGDVMLGRGVAQVAAADPQGLFAGIRFQVFSADLALANLESPLTRRPHVLARGPDALEASPASAGLLAAAGFDAMALANNHAGDAGPRTVPDTMGALSAAGLAVVGAGRSEAAAFQPRILRAGALRVAFLSFDATGEGPRAGPSTPGVAWWDPARAHHAVLRARAEADLVIVGLHGGVDYEPTTDPYVMGLARVLASWGVDVVWGSGPHVVQPVRVIDPNGRGRSTVVATSLGNLLFDQHIPGTRQGALLEVLAGADGVRAFRVGATDQTDGPVTFRAWRLPAGDAAGIGDGWWTLARGIVPSAALKPRVIGFPSKVIAAALGDPEGKGIRQLVISFRRPYRPTAVNALIPISTLVDRHRLTAHLGIYRPGDLRPEWVAGTLLRPIAKVAACDGALAVAYSTLNGTAVVDTGAWVWQGFDFQSLPDLAGPGRPACADVEGDGRLDPVILGRSSS